ncbi:MAG: ABC transporter substrate-binding protein [Clostridia bacterium]|nr:ABC transporter substrate-binding protein [Clostridia bacterium]
MKKLLCILLCLMLVPLYATAENVEDSLIVGMLSTRTTELTPLFPKERDIVSLYSLMYESLVTIDDNGIPQPLLAESWTETGDGKTWTFTLRENITFSDGTPLTARDVAASGNKILSVAKDEQAEDNGFYANIRYLVNSFTARDDRTVEVKAARPYYGLLYSMTFPVVPESQVDYANPVGTGPYLVSGFEACSFLLLSVNENWWQMTPQVREITVMFYPNNKDMITAYEYGRVDTVFTRSVAAAQYKSGLTSLSIAYSTRQLEMVMLNHRERSFPLDNVNVRRAVRYAINVDSIAKNAYMGMTVKADAGYPTDSWLYLDQENQFVYNPDKAREILAAEGWSDLDNNGILDLPVEGAPEPKHLVLSLYVYEDPENDVRYETANMIADDLKKVGISVHVETVDYAGALEVLKAGSFDMFLCAFQIDVVPDLGFILRKGNSQNYGRYASTPMTDLIDELHISEDQAGFAYASQAIQQQFAADVPFISLFYRAGAILTRKMFTTVRSIREFELLRGIEAFGR